jgi:hypothetical protein
LSIATSRCKGDGIEQQQCNLLPCPYAMPWGQWTGCSVTCGQGSRTRTRKCSTPGGCQEQMFETIPCSTSGCMTLWTEWSTCDKVCGGGTQTRIRDCMDSRGNCGGDLMENRKCNKHFCEKWGEWVTTQPCFSPMGCGTGSEVQQRPCDGGLPGAPGCKGEESREVRCQLEPCPAQWGQWMAWTSCSKSCGENIQKQRRRLCEDRQNPRLCIGSDTEYAMCNLPQCRDLGSEWIT